MSGSPYDPPQIPEQPVVAPSFAIPSQPPKVWQWYKIYCLFMLLVYLLCLVAGVFIFLSAETLAADDPDESPIVYVIQGVVFFGIGSVLSVLYGIALWMRPCKTAWYLGFATIGIGLTSACCLPASIPLLIFWLKQETRYFLQAMPGQS